MTEGASVHRRIHRELSGMPLRLRLTVLLMILLAVALIITGTTVTAQVGSFLAGRQDAELRAASTHLVGGALDNKEARQRAFTYVPTNSYAVELQTISGKRLTFFNNPDDADNAGNQPQIPALTSSDKRVTSHKVFRVPSKTGENKINIKLLKVKSLNFIINKNHN